MAQSILQSILVTGGAGFVGTHLCRKLTEMGYSVRVLDIKAPETQGTKVQGVQYTLGDVRNRELLKSLTQGVDAVYHLAATVSVPLCQNDPIESYSNNFTATLCVLEAIRSEMKSSGKTIRMIFASTAALYGSKGDDGRALAEADIADEFMSFYAGQKRASEQAIQLYRTTFGIPAMIFRFFNIFGPGQDPTSPYSGVITVFSKMIREGKDLPLNAGGNQTRDFISVRDIAEACANSLKLPAESFDAKPINLGSGKAITVRQLAETIVEIYSGVAGKKSKLITAPPREGDVVHSLADISRAKKVLGFKPHQSDLKTGLTELLS